MKKQMIITGDDNGNTVVKEYVAPIVNTATLGNALNELGMEYTTHTETEKGAIAVTAKQTIDGEETDVTIYVTDDLEKQAIHAIDALMAVDTYKPAKQCAVFAYMYELGTWKTNGFKKFSDYAMSVNKKLSDGTIRKYANIGRCFFKQGTIEPQFVDDRLKGVSVNNLDAIIAYFKAWADKQEVDSKPDNYRDYVPQFLDNFYDPENGVSILPLRDTQPTVKDAIAKLNGKPTSEEKKNDKKTKKSDNSEELSAVDALILAIANYSTDKTAKPEVVALLDKVSGLLAQ